MMEFLGQWVGMCNGADIGMMVREVWLLLGVYVILVSR